MYHLIIGEPHWSELPACIREIHSEGEARGVFRIHRAKGLAAAMIAWLCGFPESGEKVPIRLWVRRKGARLIWRRELGAKVIETWQETRNGLIAEHFGAFVCLLEARRSAIGIEHRQVGCLLEIGPLRLRLPAWIAPRVAGSTWAEHGIAHVRVSVRVPFVGSVLDYEGPVTSVDRQ